MTLVRPRLTEFHGLDISQASVDFAIPFLNEDLPLYVDPFLLWKSPSLQDQSLHGAMIAAFRGQAAARSTKYEGSTMQQFSALLKFVVDEDCWVKADEFHKKLVSLSAHTKDRLVEGESKDAALRELDELIKRTRPSPGRQRGKLTKPAADVDDDITF
jgi:hypothetical protein